MAQAQTRARRSPAAYAGAVASRSASLRSRLQRLAQERAGRRAATRPTHSGGCSGPRSARSRWTMSVAARAWCGTAEASDSHISSARSEVIEPSMSCAASGALHSTPRTGRAARVCPHLPQVHPALTKSTHAGQAQPRPGRPVAACGEANGPKQAWTDAALIRADPRRVRPRPFFGAGYAARLHGTAGSRLSGVRRPSKGRVNLPELMREAGLLAPYAACCGGRRGPRSSSTARSLRASRRDVGDRRDRRASHPRAATLTVHRDRADLGPLQPQECVGIHAARRPARRLSEALEPAAPGSAAGRHFAGVRRR